MSLGRNKLINSYCIRLCAFIMFSFVHLNAIAEESVMNQLVEVDFQLSKKKEGVITVELASAAATVDLRKEKDKDRKSVV